MVSFVVFDGLTMPSLPQFHNRAQIGHPLSKRSYLLPMSTLKFSTHPPTAAAMVENVIKCKWSLTVFRLVREGVNRPGAMERAVPGLTTKVLNERLRKFVRFGVFERREFAELPPRVEYSLTPFGQRFAGVLDAVDALQKELPEAN